jgi:hypothetical protein
MARPFFLVPFRRVLRLAGSRWRYSTPPPHGWLQRVSKGCSHSNDRQIREVGALGDGDLYTFRRKPASGREVTRRIQSTEEKRLETGESYRAVEAQSERRLCTDLLTEFVQGTSKCGIVEDFVCYCSNNLLNVVNICRSAWWLSNKSNINYLSRCQDTWQYCLYAPSTLCRCSSIITDVYQIASAFSLALA